VSNNNAKGERESKSRLETPPTVFAVVVAVAVALSGCASMEATPPPTLSSRPPVAASPPGLGSTFVSPADGMTMIFVPAGEFVMGSEIGLTDEQPVHTVFLDAFWIDQTEVTNAMYKLCVQSGACSQPSTTTYYGDATYSDHPVVFVSWNQAVAYCAWVGRRLPTEAEWEKAATWESAANKKRVYPWGNDFDCQRGNFEGSDCDGYDQTSPARSFPSGASPYGVLDMGGNAWEWVHDAFLETDPFTGGKTYYAVSPAANPSGPDPKTSIYRVLRGGAWEHNFGFGRSAYRLWFGLDDTYNFTGFRCALTE